MPPRPRKSVPQASTSGWVRYANSSTPGTKAPLKPSWRATSSSWILLSDMGSMLCATTSYGLGCCTASVCLGPVTSHPPGVGDQLLEPSDVDAIQMQHDQWPTLIAGGREELVGLTLEQSLFLGFVAHVEHRDVSADHP